MNKLYADSSRWIVAVVLGIFTMGAQAALVGSKHDLASETTNTDQVCVFCHTPHGSDNTAAVPLWNKKINAATVYTTYGSLGTATFDGAEAPINGGISLACLTCHDGGTAMDSVLNAPGSGGYNGAGSEIDAIAIGTMPGDGIALSLPIPNLGTDLSDDHPIAVVYAGGGCDETACSVASIQDPDFNVPDAGVASNGTNIWWFDTDADTLRDKNEVQLYTRTDFAGLVGTEVAGVECASCHDVHNGALAATDVEFMRVNTAASAICTTCHIK